FHFLSSVSYFCILLSYLLFFSTASSPSYIYTLSLHDALPIFRFYTPRRERYVNILTWCLFLMGVWLAIDHWLLLVSAGHFDGYQDRKSTRLNSSHSQISYAVFCLKKKKNKTHYNNYILTK